MQDRGRVPVCIDTVSRVPYVMPRNIGGAWFSSFITWSSDDQYSDSYDVRNDLHAILVASRAGSSTESR